MTDDERVAEILDAALIWQKEIDDAADAWHFKDYEAAQRQAWTNFTARVSKVIRKGF